MSCPEFFLYDFLPLIVRLGLLPQQDCRLVFLDSGITCMYILVNHYVLYVEQILPISSDNDILYTSSYCF